jgi:hypothetical protein
VSVPVNDAAELIVWLLIRPVVSAPRVELPAVSAVVKRLVEDAVVEKILVVVAAVVVLLVMRSNICAAVKVFAVYVLGIVVEELIYVFTRVSV